MNIFINIAVIIICYLIGSIQIGIIYTKIHSGIDIREFGSKSSGATNISRTLGFKPGLFVLIIDLLKGILPILIIKTLMEFQLIAILSSCSLVLGHCFPIFYQFRGGKGIATGTGAVLYQIPILLLVIPIFLIVSVFTRFISLGSIISCISSILIVTVLVITNNLDSEYLIIGVFIPLLIIFNHRQNIKRLIEKKENKFSFKKNVTK